MSQFFWANHTPRYFLEYERPPSALSVLVEVGFYVSLVASSFRDQLGIPQTPLLTGGLLTAAGLFALSVVIITQEKIPTAFLFAVAINFSANFSHVVALGRTPILGEDLPELAHWASNTIIFCYVVRNDAAARRLLLFLSMALLVSLALGGQFDISAGRPRLSGEGSVFFDNSNQMAHNAGLFAVGLLFYSLNSGAATRLFLWAAAAGLCLLSLRSLSRSGNLSLACGLAVFFIASLRHQQTSIRLLVPVAIPALLATLVLVSDLQTFEHFVARFSERSYGDRVAVYQEDPLGDMGTTLVFGKGRHNSHTSAGITAHNTFIYTHMAYGGPTAYIYLLWLLTMGLACYRLFRSSRIAFESKMMVIAMFGMMLGSHLFGNTSYRFLSSTFAVAIIEKKTHLFGLRGRVDSFFRLKREPASSLKSRRKRRGVHSATGLICALASLLVAQSSMAGELYAAPDGAGRGSRTGPLPSAQAAIDLAQPGDVIILRDGIYNEYLETRRAGTPNAPITLRSESGRGAVTVTSRGRVLRIFHPHIVVEDLVLDGQYGDHVTLAVHTGPLTLRRVEVLHSGRDCIDLNHSQNVLLEDVQIHHCLHWRGDCGSDPAAQGACRVDAHGVAGGAVRNLVMRRIEIHTVSGDAIQFDPGRTCPSWDNVSVEASLFRLEPLPRAIGRIPAGTVPGENAIDTKTCGDPAAPRARLEVRDSVAHGWRGGLIRNMAAFNLKENVDAILDGVTVSNSEIAFRLRGPGSRPGARVRLQNPVIYDSDVAFRYESKITELRIWNATIGRSVARPFLSAGAERRLLDVRNVLILGDSMDPEGRSHPSNLVAHPSWFENVAEDNYRLVPGAPAIDAGVLIDGVETDREGTPRPLGDASDVGAYEYRLDQIGQSADLALE